MRLRFISGQARSVSSNPTTLIHTRGDMCQQVPNECSSDPPRRICNPVEVTRAEYVSVHQQLMRLYRNVSCNSIGKERQDNRGFYQTAAQRCSELNEQRVHE